MTTKKIRIPVLVREDGAYFVWEMDTTWEPSHGRKLVDMTPERAARALGRAGPPFYRDLTGRAPEEVTRLRQPNHGTTRMVMLECEVTLPLPVIENIETAQAAEATGGSDD